MYSSAELLLTSFDRNDPGSSSTSPSRLPRMFVENQPFSPSRRDFRPGAIRVFLNFGILNQQPGYKQTSATWRLRRVWGLSDSSLGVLELLVEDYTFQLIGK